MVSSKDIRLRLCDPNKKRLPLIKEQLRNKVATPWFGLTEKELSRYVLWYRNYRSNGLLFHCIEISYRIRRPFESYDRELLEEGYPESSQHLQRLLAIKNERGERDTTLIDDKALLDHTMKYLKHLETCQRDRCKKQEYNVRLLPKYLL